ncbi:hypothetical protein PRZ48_014279 [Zasmidium cellare]|uniref:Uncharacterized protein n=1 Tax=Zasmidium cellare TaxID=395010 RepID=A0ABR0E185_ZASCE|nr:hypothetical protein PRZ48_014279 [Zasmidium cellare]
MTSIMTTSESDELNQRIHNLPQELQDRILDCTTAIEPGMVTIDDDYRPPWQLRINRATRSNCAKQYYTTSIFKLRKRSMNDPLIAVLVRWLTRLPVEHVALVTHIRVGVLGDWPDDRAWKENFARQMAGDLPVSLRNRCNLRLDNPALKISVHFVGGEGNDSEPVEVLCSEA